MLLRRLFLFCLLTTAVAFAADNKVERVSRPAGSSISEAVWQILDPNGYRVVLEDGPLCEIWLRKSVPASGAKTGQDAMFPQLAPSTLVGAVNFLKSSMDYKGDPIKPGFYTLRYELLPADGNHLGVAPNPDFLLVLPPGADTDPECRLEVSRDGRVE